MTQGIPMTQGPWALLDPFAAPTLPAMEVVPPVETGSDPRDGSEPRPEPKIPPGTRQVLSLDGVLLRWNAEAKHRLRAAGWEVQGGMTYRTLDLVRDWTRAQIARHAPAAFQLRLPPLALLPDLSSPNACLLLGSVLPEVKAAGLDFVVRRDGDPADWECARAATEKEAQDIPQVLASALGPGKLWLPDGSGIVRRWNGGTVE